MAPLTVSRAEMDEFQRRLAAVEKLTSDVAAKLGTHLEVCELLQRQANSKMNWILGGLVLLVLMTLLGPRQGIIEALSRMHY